MESLSGEHPIDTPAISLKWYYWIGAFAIAIGVAVVFILNLATPVEFILQGRARFDGASSPVIALEIVGILGRFFSIVLLSWGILLVAVRRLLRPIQACLACLRAGRQPSEDLLQRAKRRLLNLPFLYIPVNVAIWLVLPSVIFGYSWWRDLMEFHLAFVLSARTSMVGLVASSIAFYGVEAYSRRKLIPLFFPDGHLTEIAGAARLSISRRIRMLYRLGSLVPMTMLIVTLFTLQLEVSATGFSAVEYGRNIILFTVTLTGVFFVTTAVLNRQVSRNISQPLGDISRTLTRVRDGRFDQKVRVISNDEIGYVGDVINEMIDGLIDRDRMREALHLAREVQQNLLPRRGLKVDGLDIAGRSIYCDETGGDYFDFFAGDGCRKVCVAIGDVSGHGIPSALLMATVRAFLRQRSVLAGSPDRIIADVNQQLVEDVEDTGQFVTLFYLVFDRAERSLQWVRAGHDPAVLYDPESDSIQKLMGKGAALGISDDIAFEESARYKTKAGQVILLGTDGVWEARDTHGHMLGRPAVYDLLRRYAALNADQIVDRILQELETFMDGANVEDDITLVVIKVEDGHMNTQFEGTCSGGGKFHDSRDRNG